MHHALPRRRHGPSVSRTRSLLTLAASTGPRHSRRAGTARLVVLQLWVGPTTKSEWPVRRPAGAAPSRAGAEQEAARRRGVRDQQGAEIAPPGPAGPRRVPPCRRRPPGRGPTAVYEIPASVRRRGPAGSTTSVMAPATPCRAVIGQASVSTMGRSVALRRCCTRKDRCPDLPQRDAPPQLGQQVGLGGREGQEVRRRLELARRLRVDHPGLRVREQALGQRHLLRIRRTDRAQVGHPVQDRHVGHAQARESFHDDCSQRATPRFDRMAHASSTTRKKRPRPEGVAPPPARGRPGQRRLQPGRGAGHQDAERGRASRRAERSRTTSGAERSSPGVVGPSNMP